jgi:hypothetical protein
MLGRLARLIGLALGLGLLGPAAWAADYAVTLTLHEVHSLSDDDASGGDDFYAEVSMTPTVGLGPNYSKSTFDDHYHDNNDITPNRVFSSTVSGGNDAEVQIVLSVWDHDTTSADDHFDIHPNPGNTDLVLGFRPATQQLTIQNVPGWAAYRCSAGRITLSGLDGDDRAKVVFSVSGSLAGAINGDSDGDGLPDNWEICGVDNDGDGTIDVDLPAMGAKPYRKDLFVEIDWMVQNVGAPGDHTHAPWLPSLMNAWNELNTAPVTNPTVNGVASPAGIALHVDVGTLYANYTLNVDNAGPAEITVDGTGNIDMNGDGIPDIGNLSPLGRTTPGGGNALGEQAVLNPSPLTGSFFDAASTFGTIKAANFNATRNTVFRYCVFGHSQVSTPPNSSGRAEALAAGSSGSNDFYVTLGFPPWPRQTFDTNLDGVPDPGAANLPGPGGLVVDGTIAMHTGTFLHELGHTLGLGHGGGDAVNFKPNYLSIMSYTFQNGGLPFDFDNNGTADPVGLDLNRDGVIDGSRYLFSFAQLPNLNENAGLNDPAGIGDGNILTTYSVSPTVNLVRLANGPLDWLNDGDITDFGVTLDINNADGTGLTPLTGFNDYVRIANGGLAFQAQAPCITPDELRDFRRKTKRIISLRDEADLTRLADAPLERIDFEGPRPGQRVANRYAPRAIFVEDNLRVPRFAGPKEREGVPTQSPRNSVINVPADAPQPAPLLIRFPHPQRLVALYVGWHNPAGKAQDSFAVLKAYDLEGDSMGEVRHQLLEPKEGITSFLGIAAIFPEQPIAAIELRYIGGAGHEPVEIDDLMLCVRSGSAGEPAKFPDPPLFGQLPTKVTVEGRVLWNRPGGDKEPGHGTSPMTAPLGAVPIGVDATPINAPFSLTKKEGETLKFSAPPDFLSPVYGYVRFRYWRAGDTIFFADKQTEIAVRLLRDERLIAVYEPARRPRPEPDRPPHRPDQVPGREKPERPAAAELPEPPFAEPPAERPEEPSPPPGCAAGR